MSSITYKMKEKYTNLSKLYIKIVSVILTLCAVIWLVLKAMQGKLFVSSIAGILSVLALSMLVMWLFKTERKQALFIMLFLVCQPFLLDAAVSGKHMCLLPDAPKGTITQLNVQRFAWPQIVDVSAPYDMELGYFADIQVTVTSPKMLWESFFPLAESKKSTEELSYWYKEIVKEGVDYSKTIVAKGILKDFASYAFANFSPEFHLSGLTGTYTGDNYISFGAASRFFERFYWHFAVASQVGLLLLSIASLIGKRKPSKKVNLSCLILILAVTLYDIYFPLRGFDYKNAGLIILCWQIIFLHNTGVLDGRSHS